MTHLLLCVFLIKWLKSDHSFNVRLDEDEGLWLCGILQMFEVET